MKASPGVPRIRQWLVRHPLGLFSRGSLAIIDIDPKPWSGHFNYLVETSKRRMVLRFKGPEWGSSKGIENEYKILQHMTTYSVAPRPLYLFKNFFGETAELIEYLEGKPLTELPSRQQSRYFRKIARMIAVINRAPVVRSVPFGPPSRKYLSHLKTWRRRIEFIRAYSAGKRQAARLAALMPAAERMLRTFDVRLKRVLGKTGNSFIYESSHAGHCLITPMGPRFINWERVSYGDPSYTLAVFLASLEKRSDFPSIKRLMVREYLRHRSINEFPELVDQRLSERSVANLTWVIQNEIRMKGNKARLNTPEIRRRFRAVEGVLAPYSAFKK